MIKGFFIINNHGKARLIKDFQRLVRTPSAAARCRPTSELDAPACFADPGSAAADGEGDLLPAVQALGQCVQLCRGREVSGGARDCGVRPSGC
jgi:hypothetical protein